MDDDKKVNSKDIRQMCKYGVKCYQTNSDHVKRFKHPVKRDPISPNTSPDAKKMKLGVQREHIRESPSPRTPTKVESDDSVINDEQRDGSVSPSFLSEAVEVHPVHSSLENENPIGFHSIPSDVPEFIKEKFLVQMPTDFYSFWNFCCSISNGKNTMDVFKNVNLILVGVFDVLNGSLPKRNKDTDYLIHWRYFYDPPEFQTVLMSPERSNFHFGYYRDSPSDLPCFIASNAAADDCQIKPVAENIFGAVLCHLENTKKKSPFTSIACQKIITPLREWANKHKFSLDTYSDAMKKRQKLIVAKTFHGAGIVVSVDKKNSVGYRPISETNAKLKVLMSRVTDAENESGRVAALANLQPIITNANLATDECDFGTGLELGIDFFCTGEKAFHSTIKSLMCVAYNMLNRDTFGTIIMAHLDNRRKGCKLSVSDL